MRALIGVSLWIGVAYSLAQAIPSRSLSQEVNLCDEIKYELVQAVNRGQIGQKEAAAIYERCTLSQESNS